MLLICAEPPLATRLGRLVVGQRVYAMNLEAGERMAAEHQPSVVLLDVRVGGSENRAVEWVPAFLRASPSSAVVVVTMRPTVAEVSEANALGAYTYIDRLADGFVIRLHDVIATAKATAPQRVVALHRAVH